MTLMRKTPLSGRFFVLSVTLPLNVYNFLLDAKPETMYDTVCNDFVTFR
mgnify:FL=1